MSYVRIRARSYAFLASAISFEQQPQIHWKASVALRLKAFIYKKMCNPTLCPYNYFVLLLDLSNVSQESVYRGNLLVAHFGATLLKYVK